MFGKYIFGRIIDDFLGGVCDACEDFNDNFDMTEYIHYKIREENEKRKKVKFIFPNELTEKDFEKIVIDICEKIRRITKYCIDGEIVYITVISNSGLSEWICELDFNDYGRLTGRYWIWSANDDSEIPEIVASRISERVCLTLGSHFTKDDDIDDDEYDDEYDDDECDDDEYDDDEYDDDEYDDDEYDDDDDDELWSKGINRDIAPQPIEFNVFFDTVAEALIEVENKKIGYFSLGYTPKRKDNISCIQTCLDDEKMFFDIEIVVNSDDDKSFRIYGKNRLSRREVLDIFYNVCVEYDFPNLKEWYDVTKQIK